MKIKKVSGRGCRLSTIKTMFLTIFFCGVCYAAESQIIQIDKPNYTPPSPNAAALLEYASIPVSLHTGTAEVSVPLGELQTRKASISISISYHASGIKVQDLASSVGLGWVLNAGGVITRIVRGLPDEGAQGYCTRDFNSTYADVANLTQGNIDGEPDIYFFNFMGFKGRMVMDPNRNVIPLPEQNLKIVKPNFSSSDPTWEITDTKGVRYVFGNTSSSREVSSVTRHTQYAPNPPQPDPSPNWHDDNYSAITSWYLAEVHYPFETDVITFSYQTGGAIYYENYSQSQNSEIEMWDGCNIGYPDPNVLDHINQITISAPKYISNIFSSFGMAHFVYSSREDIPNGLRLSLIRIIGDDIVKSYSLENAKYFVSDDCATADCKRLKLEGIKETTNRSQIRYRIFGYNTTNLPSRKSVKYDHWGYYNNNTNPHAIPPSKVYYRYLAQSYISFTGADKAPVLDRTTANILVQITNEVGAVQKLFYELNQYDDSGTTRDTGGVRISKITEDDGSGINGVQEKKYKYKLISNSAKSSGIRYRNYVYDYAFVLNANCFDPVFGGQQSGITTAMRFSSSAVDLFDISGSHVGYSDVQVEYLNGGNEHYFFTGLSDHPDVIPEFSIPNGYNGSNGVDFTNLDGPPFVPYSDRSFERGLLKKHVYFNSSGKKVKEIKNNYDFYQASALEAPGVKAMVLAINGPAVWARRGKYKYSHLGVRLLNTSQKEFDDVDQTKRFSKTTSYTYNATYSNLVKEETSLLNDGAELKIEYKYPFDYSNPASVFNSLEAAGVNGLKTYYCISIPLETTAWLKSHAGGTFNVIESKLVTYREGALATNYTVDPFQVFKLKINSPVSNFVPGADTRYQLIHTYSSYDRYGNLLMEIPQDGVVTKYVWTGNGSFVNTITKSPSDGPHTTTFVHKPMVGLESVTDPAGHRTTYVYDNLNRLKLVKDHNSNIMSRYRYHYRDQYEFGSSFQVTGSLKVNQSQAFDVLTFESIGITSYTWDFGDGQSITGTSPTVYHTYTNVGTYTIKLIKTNPEYGTSETSIIKQITN